MEKKMMLIPVKEGLVKFNNSDASVSRKIRDAEKREDIDSILVIGEKEIEYFKKSGMARIKK